MSAEQHTFQSESHMRSKVQPDYSPTGTEFEETPVRGGSGGCRSQKERRRGSFPVFEVFEDEASAVSSFTAAKAD